MSDNKDTLDNNSFFFKDLNLVCKVKSNNIETFMNSVKTKQEIIDEMDSEGNQHLYLTNKTEMDFNDCNNLDPFEKPALQFDKLRIINRNQLSELNFDDKNLSVDIKKEMYNTRIKSIKTLISLAKQTDNKEERNDKVKKLEEQLNKVKNMKKDFETESKRKENEELFEG